MHIDRRAFLAAASAGWWLSREASLKAQAPSSDPPRQASGAPPVGQSPLGLSDDGRDGVVYVPKRYRDDVPAPLLVMLHGFAGWADEMKSTFALAEEFGKRFALALPAEIEGSKSEDLKRYLPNFMEERFRTFADAQGEDLAKRLEQVAEEAIAFVTEDAKERNAKRLEAMRR